MTRQQLARHSSRDLRTDALAAVNRVQHVGLATHYHYLDPHLHCH